MRFGLRFWLFMILSPAFVSYDLFRALVVHRRYNLHVFEAITVTVISIIGVILFGLLGGLFFFVNLHYLFGIAMLYMLTSCASLVNFYLFTKVRG